jgi:hypothetical protein
MKQLRSLWHPILVVALLLVTGGAPSGAWADGATLEVQGPDGATHPLPLRLIAALPTHEVNVLSEDGEHESYRCATVSDVLDAALATSRPVLKGKAMLDALVANASDGYAVLYSLAEVDASFVNTSVFLCFERDGQPLPASDGPFRIIVPRDTRHARWIRGVVKLAVVTERKDRD